MPHISIKGLPLLRGVLMSSSLVFTGSGSLDPVWSNGDFMLYSVDVP